MHTPLTGDHNAQIDAQLRHREQYLDEREARLLEREARIAELTSIYPHLLSPVLCEEDEQRTTIITTSAGQMSTYDHDPQQKGRHSAAARYFRSGKYMRSMVFGGLDGLTTSVVLVCSTKQIVSEVPESAAAGLISGSVLFALGLANLLADAFSMGMGDFLGTVAEMEQGGSESMFIEAMLNGFVMFVSFVCFGSLPLMAYCPLWATSLWRGREYWRFVAACALAGLSLLALGAAKGFVLAKSKRVTGVSAMFRLCFKAAVAMALTGGAASVVAFFVSSALHYR